MRVIARCVLCWSVAAVTEAALFATVPLASASADRQALIVQGIELVRQGKAEEAKSALVEVRKQDTNEPTVHLALGAALLHLGRYEGAEEEFDQVLLLTEEATARQVAWSGLGVCWLRAGQDKKAAERLGLLVDSADDSAAARACLAYALLSLGDYQGARRCAERAALTPEVSGFALAVIGHTYSRADPGKAVDWFSRALRASRAGQRRVSLGQQAAVSALSLPASTAGSPVREMRASISRTGDDGVAIEPTYLPAKTHSVTFWLDGSFRNATNRPPFRFEQKVGPLGPGRHTMALDAVDANGAIIGSAAAGFRADNGGAGPESRAGGADPAWVRTVAERLRAVVRPVADIASLNYFLGRAYENMGSLSRAAKHYEAAFAAREDYKDALQRLLDIYRKNGAALGSTAVEPLRGKAHLVALTFDDGPNPLFTPRLLEILRMHHVRATFFMVGTQVLSWPELARQVADEGHEIGNHSFSHPNMKLLSPEKVEHEVLRAKVVIEQATGRATRLFRPPGGRFSDQAIRAAAAVGHRTVLWTSNILESQVRDPRAIALRMARELAGGGIALMHNGRDETVEVLPQLLARLKTMGVRFVTVSELLASQRNGR